jgi:hypothetical protein
MQTIGAHRAAGGWRAKASDHNNRDGPGRQDAIPNRRRLPIQAGRVTLRITITRMSDRRYEFLLALHELVEALLCKETGVSQAAVDAFDVEYEKRRKPGDDSEPGDAAGAPYRREHVIASVTEHLAADLLKVDWNRYGAEVASK